MSAPSEQGFSHLSGKKVLVTGGTGFVGRHLLPRLLESGARVTCLTRAASRTEHLPGDVAVARADLGTGHGLAAALAGQDVVIHMAALLFGLGWQDYLRANALAARVIVNALAEVDAAGQGSGQGGPARFVLVSSLAASGPSDCPPGVADDVLPAQIGRAHV